VPLIYGSTVKDLVQRMRDVAVVLEVLRQRHHIRQAGTEQILWLIRIEIHASTVRSQAGEQAEASRRTERHLAIVCHEDCPLRRQPVDVRRLNPRLAVTAEQRLEVVGDDEEDVRLMFWGVVGVKRNQRRKQADLFSAIYDNQWVVQVVGQLSYNRFRFRGSYTWAENPIDESPGMELGGVVQPGDLRAFRYTQGLLAVTSPHRISFGVGVVDAIPGIDLDVMAGGMFRDTEQLGNLATSQRPRSRATGLARG